MISTLLSFQFLFLLIQFIHTIKSKNIWIINDQILTKGLNKDFSREKNNKKALPDNSLGDLIEQLDDALKAKKALSKENNILSHENSFLKENLSRGEEHFSSQLKRIEEGINEEKKHLNARMEELHDTVETVKEEETLLEDLEIYEEEQHENHGLLVTVVTNCLELLEQELHRNLRITERLSNFQGQNNDSQDHLKSIFKEIKKIEAVGQILNELTEKTSILSLNAAIESAHAGEAGKGFAIVAEEVRVLAETTGEKGEEISDRLFELSKLMRQSRLDEEEEQVNIPVIIGELKHANKTIEQIEVLIKSIRLDSQPRKGLMENFTSSPKLEKIMLHLSQCHKMMETQLVQIDEIRSNQQNDHSLESLIESKETAVTNVSPHESFL